MLILRYKFGNYDLKDAASKRYLSKLLTIYPSKISIKSPKSSTAWSR